MNSLSWFIYIIGVVDSFRDLIGFLIGIPTILIVLCGIVYAIMSFICYIEDETQMKGNMLDFLKSWYKTVFIILAVGWILNIVIPTRQTLLLIAGSQIGERAVTSDVVKSVVDPGMDLLKTWIAAETAKLKEVPVKKEK